jgi:hypothetical protein
MEGGDLLSFDQMGDGLHPGELIMDIRSSQGRRNWDKIC